jgi:hypothetical protein
LEKCPPGNSLAAYSIACTVRREGRDAKSHQLE